MTRWENNYEEKRKTGLNLNLPIDKHIYIVYTFVTMQTVIHVRADKEVKENAVEAAKELGLSLSDIINASLRNFIRTREITFSDVPQMTPELEKLLDRVGEDIRYNKNIVGPFHNAEEMDKYLNSK